MAESVSARLGVPGCARELERDRNDRKAAPFSSGDDFKR